MTEAGSQAIQSLIVDDDRAIGDILKELVASDCKAVELCTDGLEAIEFMKRQTVDIVITDLMMPRVGGLEVLRQARMANPEAVVIIITGHASLETAIQAVREGAYDYIKKPFKLQEMEIAFNNAVEKVQLVRENRRLMQELKEAYEQLLAVESENNVCQEERKSREEKPARVNFFSNSAPSLQFLDRGAASHRSVFEQLHGLTRMREGGLLTDGEFQTLKAHLIRTIDAHE